MTFIRTDREQSNLVDGSIYAYDVRPDGMYVTVKGNDPGGTPLILSFDREDIDALRHAIKLFDSGDAEPVSEFPVDSEVFHLDGATIIGRDNYEAEMVRRAFRGDA